MKKFILFTLSVIVLTGCTAQGGGISQIEATSIAQSFIEDILMEGAPPDIKAEIREITKINGLYKLNVDPGNGELIDSYLSNDGKVFFPQGMIIEDLREKAEEAKNTIPIEALPEELSGEITPPPMDSIDGNQ